MIVKLVFNFDSGTIPTSYVLEGDRDDVVVERFIYFHLWQIDMTDMTISNSLSQTFRS